MSIIVPVNYSSWTFTDTFPTLAWKSDLRKLVGSLKQYTDIS